ncbi:hypothetical protein HanRHA438_Chr06g0271421 [Helianthus annuus]|nr:hypothetical protein HanRHA438_Chr06g0271421 [Helianthus annuus]
MLCKLLVTALDRHCNRLECVWLGSWSVTRLAVVLRVWILRV